MPVAVQIVEVPMCCDQWRNNHLSGVQWDINFQDPTGYLVVLLYRQTLSASLDSPASALDWIGLGSSDVYFGVPEFMNVGGTRVSQGDFIFRRGGVFPI